MVVIEDLGQPTPSNPQNFPKQQQGKKSCMGRCGNVIQKGMGTIFYRVGNLVAGYPIPIIAITFIAIAVLGSGIRNFTYENEFEKQFVPSNSQANSDKKWVDENDPYLLRMNQAIFLDSHNILVPDILTQLLAIDTSVSSLTTKSGQTFATLCKRKGSNCWKNSILELWSFNEITINNLTDSDISNDVNSINVSPVTGAPFDVHQYISDLSTSMSGEITSARATYMHWFLDNNGTSLDAETAKDAKEWESLFIDYMKQLSSSLENQDVYFKAARTYGDETSSALVKDFIFLFACFFLAIVFTCFVLGKCHRIHQRIYLSFGGLLCIGLSILATIGLGSYCGWSFGDLHIMLPFVALGLGLFHMFVIIQSYENLPVYCKEASIQEKIAVTMQHAGGAITISSLTSIVAIGICAITLLPGLQSFYVYVCIVVFLTYILQSTLFVAFLTLDEKRASEYCDACCCCLKHAESSSDACSIRKYTKTIFKAYITKGIVKLPIKVIIIFITLVIFVIGVIGLIKLKSGFDENWLLPHNSYAFDYISQHEQYFSADGPLISLYSTDILEYHKDLSKLSSLCVTMSREEFIRDENFDCWPTAFVSWISLNDHAISSEEDFVTNLKIFIQSNDGSRFSSSVFRFGTVNGQETLLLSKIEFQKLILDTVQDEYDAMYNLRQLIKNVGFEADEVFPYNSNYVIYEGNKTLANEMYRNFGLALLAVAVMSFILLTDLIVDLMVVTCVVFTLVDVAGLMYFWSLTIDAVTTAQLIISVGLIYNYSAHIAHAFLVEQGLHRIERVERSLSRIGPAVFYGGFSTFLSCLLLGASSSYIFTSFFKVLLGVCLFGLFHGLIFLPVLLCWVGPRPYKQYILHDPLQSKLSRGSKDKESTDLNGFTNGSIIIGNNTSNNEELNISSVHQSHAERDAELEAARNRIGIQDRGPLPDIPPEDQRREREEIRQEQRERDRPPAQPRPEWLKIYDQGYNDAKREAMFESRKKSGKSGGNIRKKRNKKKKTGYNEEGRPATISYAEWAQSNDAQSNANGNVPFDPQWNNWQRQNYAHSFHGTRSHNANPTYPGYASSNVGYASSNVGYAASNVGYAASNVGYAASSPGYASSNAGYAASNMGYSPPQYGGFPAEMDPGYYNRSYHGPPRGFGMSYAPEFMYQF